MKTIGVVTTSRADYGIYLPLLKKIEDSPQLKLYLIATGMHLSPKFGSTEKIIKKDGFNIDERIEMLLSSDTPESISKSMGLGTIGFAQSFARFVPDILVVLGDRFEMYAAVIAALPYKIPIAHIHGGEITKGAIDDAIRHSITKLSHIHFASTKEYAIRIQQLGEEPWRIHISGAPGLDNINSIKMMSTSELENQFKLDLKTPPLLVTFHPVTLEHEKTQWHVGQLLAALENIDIPTIFTLPNADTGGQVIIDKINIFSTRHKNAYVVNNFGTPGYFSIMAQAAAMIGNSSSGIIEAASFNLPVVNIGNRQEGRMHGINVIDVRHNKENILDGIKQALSCEFKEKIQNLKNPYGSGNASEIIIDILENIEINDTLVIKQFHDLNPVPAREDT